MTERRRKPAIVSIAALLCACVLLVVANGCGSSDDGSNSTESNSNSNSDFAALESAVQKETKAPTSIGIDTPVGKPIPKGKELLFLECATSCEEIGNGVETAAKELGWSYKKIQLGASPEEIAKGWQQAVQEHPDAVVSSGNPVSLFSKQLAELHQEGIPYFGCCTTDKTGDGMEANIAGPADWRNRGKLLADWIVAEKGAESNAILFNVPDYPVNVILGHGFESEYKANCSECGISTVNAQVTDIGTKLPAQVVSAVQRNPDANYLAFSIGAMTTGVPEALKAAGLDEQVKIITQNPEPVNLENIIDGDIEVAGIPLPEAIVGWMAVDAALRYFVKDPLPEAGYAVVPTQYLTASNITDPSEHYVGVTDYKQQFEKLWGLSK
jgi:ribose transport system substrate-binding protein